MTTRYAGAEHRAMASLFGPRECPPDGADVERRTEPGRRQEDRDILALVGDLERALHAFRSPIIVREGT